MIFHGYRLLKPLSTFFVASDIEAFYKIRFMVKNSTLCRHFLSCSSGNYFVITKNTF